MRAIVTGGAGFIGSHVAEALVARGDDVHVLDDLSAGKPENVPEGARLHVADIRDPGRRLRRACSRRSSSTSPRRPSVSVSVAQPALDADVNVLGTVARPRGGARARRAGRVLVDRRRHLRRVREPGDGGVGAATAVARTARPSWPARSTSPPGTGCTGRRHVALRYGNVYGPRQDPHGEAGVVAIFLRAVADGRRPTIFGDGSQERDYVYVGDVARATLAATALDGGVFNVATGEPTSVLELVDAMRRATGREIDPEHGPERLGDLQRSVLDPGLAARELGWHAEVSLEDGLRAAWQFFSAAA